jgi:hypothetical protein
MDSSTASLPHNGGEEIRPYKIHVSWRELQKRRSERLVLVWLTLN